MERETGFESVFYSHGSSLLTISRYFSMRHDGENHFSSCLFLQNLGKSRKSVPQADHFFTAAGAWLAAARLPAGSVPFKTPLGTGTATPERSSPRRQTKFLRKSSSFWKAISTVSTSRENNIVDWAKAPTT